MLTSKQEEALFQWKNLLAESGLERVLSRDTGTEPPPLAGRFAVLARLFDEGLETERHDLRTCVPDELLLILEALGLLNRVKNRVASPYRLVVHMGLWLFCEKVSPGARAYYGSDSFELSRMVLGAQGNVLDLCSGVGPQALLAARTAARVTAVEIEPLAAELFWINAAMNGLSDKVEMLTGDLLEPVAGRKFDMISCNPPFLPVPPGIRYPGFADGGSDGLAIVRRVMAGLPDALTPQGRCEVVGAVLGTSESPNLAAFKKMAAVSSLNIIVDCRTREELEGKCLNQLAGMALEDNAESVERSYRSHFMSLGATHLYCFLLHAVRAPTPTLCASYWDGQNTSFRVEPCP